MQSTQRAGVTISIGAAAAVLLVLLLLLHTSPVKRHDDHGDFCDTGEYRKNVLKLVKEAPFAGLFSDLKNHTKFEASGVAFDPRTSTFLSVFDSSMSVGRIDETLQFRGPSNVLIGEQGPESQFEGISLFDEGKNQWLGDKANRNVLELSVENMEISSPESEEREVVFTVSDRDAGILRSDPVVRKLVDRCMIVILLGKLGE